MPVVEVHLIEGIRFIDRFAFEGSLIADQRVWNDLAEVRARG